MATLPRPAAARRPAAPAPRARKVAPPAAVRVPLSPSALRRLILTGTLALLALAGIAIILASGLPQRAARSAVAATAAAGFEIRDIRISGLHQVSRDAVLDAALSGDSDAILAADLPAIRSRIEALPWVDRATVARRLPATLEIAVTERVPAAIWQRHGMLRLVDRTGRVLTPADVRAWPHLPLLVGEGAELELASLEALLKTQPALAPKVDSAVWVSQRRWDLHMKTGETIALPEGYAAAETALRQFARLEGEKPLLGQGYVRFDLRLPGKMVVRLATTPAPPRQEGTPI